MGGQLARHSLAVRERRISAVELVQASVDRIEASASDLNAVVSMRAEEALRDARALDDRLATGAAVGPLAGLPLLVKDVEDAAGLPTTFGSLLHADARPALTDGLVAGKLRAAGAILVGKTNVPEFAFEGYTDNRLFGPTRNPWARAWSPGGSSGGSGAALAAGLALIATATDVGGSIRIPAAACGLVGLKPTAGSIPVDPILPSAQLNNHGPMASTVADIRLLTDILRSPVSADSRPRQQSWTHTALPERVLAAARLSRGSSLPPGVERCFRDALASIEDHLRLAVELVDPLAIFPSGYDPDDWFRIVGFEQARLIGRDVLESRAAELDPAFAHSMARALAIQNDEYHTANRRRVTYAREVDDLLRGATVLLTPTLTVEGWSPDGRLPGSDRPGLPSEAFNTEPANLTGHPAISLPAGRLPNGVPFGLQVMGPRHGEGLLLSFAEAWESARPWPLVAERYAPFDLV